MNLNLAGFDLIIELSRGYIEDSIYSAPRSALLNTNDQDTFAPPFTWQTQVISGGSTFNANFIVNQLTLSAQPGGTGFLLIFAFHESSILGTSLGPLSLLKGTVTVAAQVGIVVDRNNAMSLAAVLGSANVNTEFDNPTCDQLNLKQPGLCKQLEDAISAVLQPALRAKGSVPMMPLPFTVDGSQESRSLNVLTSIPLLRWIDNETLALLGRYRLGLSDPALKNDSDLNKADRRAISVLLSPEGFDLVIACPVGVAGIVRDAVGDPKYNEFVEQEKLADGRKGDPTPAEQRRAHQRVDAYLDSPAGRQAILDQTPAPCGSGALTMHVNPPDPFPGTDANVRRIEMKLGAAAIDVHIEADAEIFCGSVNVSQDQHFPFKVSVGRVSLGPPRKDEPSTNFDGSFFCRAALAAIGTVISGITMGTVGSFLGFSLAANFLEKLIGEEFNKQDTKPDVNVSFMKDAYWKGVACQPDGLLFRGVMQGYVDDPVPFEPTVEIEVTVKAPDPKLVLTRHNYVDRLTGVACVTSADVKFGYYRSAMDHTITARVTSRDVPLPLAISNWTMRIGHKTSNRSIPYDPVQYGSTSFPLVPGPFTTKAPVWDPEPPLEGKVVDPMDIKIDVTASGDGFVLATDGNNLNYFIQLDADVVDAAGIVWIPRYHVGVDGVVIVLDDASQKFVDECNAKLADLNRHYAKSHPVSVWDTNTLGADRVREDLVNALHTRQVGVMRMMADATKILGESLATRVFFGPKI